MTVAPVYAWSEYVRARKLHVYADSHPDKSRRAFYKAHHAKKIADIENRHPEFIDIYKREYGSQ